MDLQMPVMDGYEAATRIRADQRFAALPIIAMTAHASAAERERCLSLGMNDHVTKPIDPPTLFAALARHCRAVPGQGIAPSAATGRQNDDEALPDVPELDVTSGLSRVAGNRKLYLKLLRQFVTDEADVTTRIQAVLGHDRKLAERLAHTVKGVGGSLGATAIHAAAGRLEAAIAENAPEAAIDPLVDDLAGALSALVARLGPAFTQPGSTPTDGTPRALDLAAARPIVEAVLTALSNFDADAADLVETHTDTLRPLFDPARFEEFLRQVGSFAMAEAHATLSAAAATHGLSAQSVR
jgi:two-component system sensor histidine kinase/response regulator